MKHCHDEINDYENLISLVYRLQDSMEQQQNQLKKLEETVLSLKEDLGKLDVCTYICIDFISRILY